MALGSTIVVPVVNPRSAGPLMRMAGRLAAADDGIVVPVTVLQPDATDEESTNAHELVRRAEARVAEGGGTARGVVTTSATTAEGVLEATSDRDASLVVMGWRGVSSTRNVFGELIDTIVGRSSVPLAIIRLGQAPPDRILFPVSTEHLLPAGARGVDLAGDLATRLQQTQDLPIVVLRAGSAEAPLPDRVDELGDRVHHDVRRVDVAVGAVARPADLIVAPVAPTTSGLRAATTHLAWAAPESSLVVAIDVGPRGDDDLATAVRQAHRQPPPKERHDQEIGHVIWVSVWPGEAEPASLADLETLLSDLGTIRSSDEVTDAAGTSLQASVNVRSPDANTALAKVMAHLHEADALRGAQIRYDVEN